MSAHAGAAFRGPRLTALLRNFGLCPVTLAKEDKQAAITAVKAAYRRLAKEQHPDTASDRLKGEASQRFAALHNDFQEALQLLEADVTPSVGSYPSSASWRQQTSTRSNIHDTWRGYTEAPAFQHRKPLEFDLKTRVKGNVIFWSSLFMFFCGLREFLVWSAGSCYAWSRPSDANPFWVRRFKDEWLDNHDKEEHAKATAPMPDAQVQKIKEVTERKTRNIDNFYVKRGISNVRRKTQPRGWGPSL